MSSQRTPKLLLHFLALLFLLVPAAFAQFRLSTGPMPAPAKQGETQAKQPLVSKSFSKQLDVSATTDWTDTGADVQPGDKVIISSEGQLKFLEGMAGPEGMTRTWRGGVRTLPLNSAGTGALIGRIGDDPAVVPFLIGQKKEFTATRPGRLFLGINLGANERLNGAFKAAIQITPPDKAAAQTAD